MYDEEKDDDEEHHAMAKDIKSSTCTSNDIKHERKVSKCDVDGSDHNGACKVAECQSYFKQESKAVECANDLVKDLKQGVEEGCAKCEKLQENSRRVEAIYETLVSELKDELSRALCHGQEEEHLEVDDMRK